MYIILINLSYASNVFNLKDIENNKRYFFKKLIFPMHQNKNILGEFQPDIILHLAAETHVDRSIDNPIEF